MNHDIRRHGIKLPSDESAVTLSVLPNTLTQISTLNILRSHTLRWFRWFESMSAATIRLDWVALVTRSRSVNLSSFHTRSGRHCLNQTCTYVVPITHIRYFSAEQETQDWENELHVPVNFVPVPSNNDPLHQRIFTCICVIRPECDDKPGHGRKPTGSGVEWAECSLTIRTGCRIHVYSLVLESSVGLSAGIQSAGDLVHSAEEDNLSPFHSNIACTCQSIQINNSIHVYASIGPSVIINWFATSNGT